MSEVTRLLNAIERGEAPEKFEREDPVAARLVNLRFFAGLTNAEAAPAVGVSERTAKRCWTFALAWLFQELRRTPGS